MSIILIGMPSCGKSTLGVLLAKKMGYEFIDSDLLIQKKHGKLLHELITEQGNDVFLELEAKVNCEIDATDAIIATGGSAVLKERAANHLTSLGTTVYISLPLADIEKRITDLSSRGVAMSRGETLGDVYERRVPIYEKYVSLPCREMRKGFSFAQKEAAPEEATPKEDFNKISTKIRKVVQSCTTVVE